MKRKRIDRLEKKKIKERARRAKIKNDPILYEQLKERDRQLYKKRKAEGKIVKLCFKSQRELKALRARSRESSKKYYYKKKIKLAMA